MLSPLRQLSLGLIVICLAPSLWAKTPTNACSDALTAPFDVASSGWSRDRSNQQVFTAAETGVTANDLNKLRVSWAFGFDDTVHPRSMPAITDQAIFIGSEEGRIFALHPDTGCSYWQFPADAEVRTAISIGQVDDQWLVFFGDQKGQSYALDALNGKLIWKTRIEKHPNAIITGSPVFVDGLVLVPFSSLEVANAANPVYNCCNFRGSVNALDAKTGEIKWRYYTVAEKPQKTFKSPLGVQQYGPSGAAVWSSPAVDIKHRRLYIGTGQNYSSPATSKSNAIIAINLDTGKEIWATQTISGDAWNSSCFYKITSANCPKENGSDFDFGAPPVLVNAGTDQPIIVAGQKSGGVYAFDANTGKILWQKQVGRGGFLGGVHWGIAADEKSVYVPIADTDIAVLPNVKGTPRSGMNKLDLKTGNLLWHTPMQFNCDESFICKQGMSAAITVIPGAILAGGLDGILYAFDTDDGEIIWQYDTKASVKTINDVEASGGTLDATAPIVVNGKMYLNSGYGGLFSVGSRSGNVFLAFDLAGK